MPNDRDLGIRLAFRDEGEFWNAYLAPSATMLGAKLVGSIALGVVQRNKKLKQQFIDLMQAVITAALNHEGVTDIHWPKPHRAPDNERSGHG